MQHTDYTLSKSQGGQPRKPRNQAEFRSVYIADLLRAAEANGRILTNIPELPIRRPTSRTGRKSLRKSFDADCKRLRRAAGAPARTGPPIPKSESNGHRRFYTLAQCRHGGRLSGVARRDQAVTRWQRIQQLHYRRYSLRAIARRVGLGRAQVGRRGVRAPMVVNSVRGTRRPWARVLALNEVYRSRCRGEDGLYKRMTARQGAYLKGIIKNRGVEQAEEIEMATTSYVQSLSSLDVEVAVRQVNLDSGYQPAAGTYHGATFWQCQEPSSTACEDGGS